MFAAVMAAAGPASAGGTFYGASRNGELFAIDISTGAGTLVGTLPVGGACGGGTTEIESDNLSRRAFAQCSDGSFTGFEFDITTAVGIGGLIPNPGSFNGLETVGGTWYGTVIFGPQGPSELHTLDPFSGTSTLIGATGVGPISGIAFDKRGGGVMYGIAGGPGPADLYTLDLGTGAAAVVGSTGIQAGSLEFGPDGRLYAGGTGPDAGNLFVIDPSNGASTLVGATGFTTVTGLTLVEPDCSHPSNPFQNCGFETGDFTSWVTQDMPSPFVPLQVGGAGLSPGFGLFTSAPTEGMSAALHGFDGDGPNHIRIAQDITVPSGGLLEFDYRAGWDLVSFCGGCLGDRTFDVLIEPAGGGTPLASSRILTAQANTMNLDTGDQLGRVDLAAFAGQTVHIAFDWFVPENFTGPAFFQLDNVRVDEPKRFFTVTPCRVVDTRNPAGPLGGPALAAGADRSFTIPGTCGIPSSASAVSVNMAVTSPTAAGNVRLHPGGSPVPLISSINYLGGQTRSNNAIVPLNSSGELAAFAAQASGTVHFILDVNGYFQ